MSVAFSPDWQRLATASVDRTAKLWNPETGQVLRTLLGAYISASIVSLLAPMGRVWRPPAPTVRRKSTN